MMKIPATLLILSSVLGVRAIPGLFHEDIAVTGCSHPDKNTDAERMFGLDGEVMMYADFNKGKEVYPLPAFVDPITYKGDFSSSVGQLEHCKANLRTSLSAYKNPAVKLEEPRVVLYPRDHVELGVDNTLICHVIGFYPAPVSVTWTRNNLNLTSDITASVPLFNKDVTFSQFSSLKFTPEQGDIYSCTVIHQSLPEPETKMWDVDQQDQSSVGPDVFCGVGLTIALLGVAMGTFFLIKGNECN